MTEAVPKFETVAGRAAEIVSGSTVAQLVHPRTRDPLQYRLHLKRREQTCIEG